MGEPQWLNEDEARAWRAFGLVGGRIFPRLDQRLKVRSGITWDDFEVMVRLSEADGRRMRMTDLAGVLLHSPSRVTQRVSRLERKELVRREKSDTDARVTYAVLTDIGYDLLTAAARHHVQTVRELFIDLLPPDKMKQLADLCEEIEEQLHDLE